MRPAEREQLMERLGARTWNVGVLAEFCKARQKNQYDFTIVISGWKGTGKSTLAYQLAKAIDPNFSLERNICISPDALDIIAQIEKMNKNCAVVLDEAIGALYIENWAEAEQKAFHQYVNQLQRKGKYAVVINCIPSLADLRGVYLRSAVDLVIHLFAPHRGIGAILLRNPTPVTQDPFQLQYLARRWEISASYEGRYNSAAQYDLVFQKSVFFSHPCFQAFIEFDKLPDEEYNAYLDFWDAHRAEINRKIQERALTAKLLREKKRAVLYVCKTHGEVACKECMLQYPFDDKEHWEFREDLLEALYFKPKLKKEEPKI